MAYINTHYRTHTHTHTHTHRSVHFHFDYKLIIFIPSLDYILSVFWYTRCCDANCKRQIRSITAWGQICIVCVKRQFIYCGPRYARYAFSQLNERYKMQKKKDYFPLYFDVSRILIVTLTIRPWIASLQAIAYSADMSSLQLWASKVQSCCPSVSLSLSRSLSYALTETQHSPVLSSESRQCDCGSEGGDCGQKVSSRPSTPADFNRLCAHTCELCTAALCGDKCVRDSERSCPFFSFI